MHDLVEEQKRLENKVINLKVLNQEDPINLDQQEFRLTRAHSLSNTFVSSSISAEA